MMTATTICTIWTRHCMRAIYGCRDVWGPWCQVSNVSAPYYQCEAFIARCPSEDTSWLVLPVGEGPLV